MILTPFGVCFQIKILPRCSINNNNSRQHICNNTIWTTCSISSNKWWIRSSRTTHTHSCKVISKWVRWLLDWEIPPRTPSISNSFSSTNSVSPRLPSNKPSNTINKWPNSSNITRWAIRWDSRNRRRSLARQDSINTNPRRKCTRNTPIINSNTSQQTNSSKLSFYKINRFQGNNNIKRQDSNRKTTPVLPRMSRLVQTEMTPLNLFHPPSTTLLTCRPTTNLRPWLQTRVPHSLLKSTMLNLCFLEPETSATHRNNS